MVDRYQTRTFDLTTRYLRETDEYGVLEKLLDAIDLEYALWNSRLDQLEKFRDTDNIPEEELIYKLSTLGGDIPPFFPNATRRAWVGGFISLQKDKGSHTSIVNAIRLVLGVTVTIETLWNEDTSWTVDSGIVGETTYVGGGDWTPPAPDTTCVGETFVVGDTKVGLAGKNVHIPRTFVIKSGVPLSLNDIEVIKYIVYKYKPAEEHWLLITPLIQDQWNLGFSQLGIGTVLHGACWIVGEGYVGITTFICGGAISPPGDYVPLDWQPDVGAIEAPPSPQTFLCSGTFVPFELTVSPVVQIFYAD